MTTTGAVPAAATVLAGPPFPCLEWFAELARMMDEQHDEFGRIGTIDCSMAVCLLDGGPGGTPWCARLDFEELSVRTLRRIDVDELGTVDFVLETDLSTWTDMVANITANGGRPDLDHTLNGLSLPGTPIRVGSSDPLGRDMFFRYNQTLQRFVNNCARIAPAPARG